MTAAQILYFLFKYDGGDKWAVVTRHGKLCMETLQIILLLLFALLRFRVELRNCDFFF